MKSNNSCDVETVENWVETAETVETVETEELSCNAPFLEGVQCYAAIDLKTAI